MKPESGPLVPPPRWLIAIYGSRRIWNALTRVAGEGAVELRSLEAALTEHLTVDLLVFETADADLSLLSAALEAPSLVTAALIFVGPPGVPQDPRRVPETLDPDASDAQVLSAAARLLGAQFPVPADRAVDATPAPEGAPVLPLPSRPSGSFRSRPAPLLPSSRPPPYGPGERRWPRPALPPALEGNTSDELMEPPAQLSSEIAELLEEMELHVGHELQPPSLPPTSPVPHGATFDLTPELEAALAEPIGDDERPSAQGPPLSQPLVPSRGAPKERPKPFHATRGTELGTGTLAVTTRPPATGQAPSFGPRPRKSVPQLEIAATAQSEHEPPLAPPESSDPLAHEPVTARPPPAPNSPSDGPEAALTLPRAPSLPRELSPQQDDSQTHTLALPTRQAPPASERLAPASPPASKRLAPASPPASERLAPASPPASKRLAPAPPSPDLGPAPATDVGQQSPTDFPAEGSFTSGQSTPLGADAATSVLARAIRTRQTGMLEYESGNVVRRIILREGDVVTAVSSAPQESLVAYLAQQCIIDPGSVDHLSHRLPSFGRHAGAALIASGHLPQEELWPTLRAHAEFVIGQTLRLTEGIVAYEADVPERLRAEPSVFGGDTGSAVLVEQIKRTLPPDAAAQRLGGPRARLIASEGVGLLDECGLGPQETDAVHFALTLDLGQARQEAPNPELASTLYALLLLGILTHAADPVSPPKEASENLDAEALRRSIARRRRLVDNADYFTLLGVPREATGYDVRRAYLELRRSLDPSRAITQQTLDLRDDLELILAVVDEAYEILRDASKRDRYRRALESAPLEHRA